MWVGGNYGKARAQCHTCRCTWRLTALTSSCWNLFSVLFSFACIMLESKKSTYKLHQVYRCSPTIVQYLTKRD
uniref:Uncharacterized protein n=1 Tax=Oryza meridionalis TaxID=40149 RepID=A0A0E0DBW5_9ORYZ